MTREYQHEIQINVTTQVAGGWAWAVVGKNYQAKCQTIQQSYKASYRVAYMRLKRL